MSDLPTANAMDEDWALLITMLPKRWRELAIETGATKGLRQDKDEERYLRVLLLHVACGYSLRETVVRAREAQLATLSDVALLKRLRKSKNWLQALCLALLSEQPLAARRRTAFSLRLIDATMVQEPGPTGSAWRLHYSLRWPQLTCDHFALSPERGVGTGESLRHFPVAQGDHLVADRIYAHYPGLAHVVHQGGQVTVRFNPRAIRLLETSGALFPLQAKLSALPHGSAVACWPVQVTGARGQNPLAGRLCVVRKSHAASVRALAKLKRSASQNQTKLQAETIFFAHYVMVFTTAPADTLTAEEALELYRLRWQIELVFKRFKQLAQLGHLPKEDADSAQAWLYGKLFAALLTERLIQRAKAFSPWGYEVAPPTQPEPLA